MKTLDPSGKLFFSLRSEFYSGTLTVDKVEKLFQEQSLSPVHYAILMDKLGAKNQITDKEALTHFYNASGVDVPRIKITPNVNLATTK
jgi:hypothetical protein